jgi:hypothetical protein
MIVENSASANSQPNEATNDIHFGDPDEPKEKMNQNDR